VISLNGQDIPFALKVNAIHWHCKSKDPSTESIPHRFVLPTNNPHRQRINLLSARGVVEAVEQGPKRAVHSGLVTASKAAQGR
jgi:hypothetical protein